MRRLCRWPVPATMMVRLAALVALLVCLVGVEAASATSFGYEVGDQLGKFTVEGGELTDTVAYHAMWRTVGSCWTTEFRDAGDPSMGWIIRFYGGKKAPVAKLKLQRLGEAAAVRLPSSWLLASGTAERDWSGFSDVRWAPQPGYEDECNSPDPPSQPQPRPPDGAAACGTDAFKLERTFLFLVPAPSGNNRYGSRAELSGTPVPSEGFSLGLCPTDSTLTGNVTSLPVLEGAESQRPLSRLAEAT